MKRSPRNRNRRQNNGGNRSLDSNGPGGKVRGAASTIYEKYLNLARDAITAGDPVDGENYFQHAEHYYRIMAAQQASKEDNKAEANGSTEDAPQAPDKTTESEASPS